MNLKGKTNAELIELQRQICADPANRNTVPGSLFKHTVAARRKLDQIAWAITGNMARDRAAKGDPVPPDGYSGRQQNRRR